MQQSLLGNVAYSPSIDSPASGAVTHELNGQERWQGWPWGLSCLYSA